MPTCTIATPCSQYVEDLVHARNAASYGMTGRLFRCVLGGHAYWPDRVEVTRAAPKPGAPGHRGPRRAKTGASSRRRLTTAERDRSLDRRHVAHEAAMAGLNRGGR